jgi:uncharacterized SAM-dependent methyltransferase
MRALPRLVRHGGLTLYDVEPSGGHLCEDAVRGLSGPRKELSPKYFYDERVARLCGPDGGLLIGVDLREEHAVIGRAYNDPEGVTTEFNLNLLARINRECGADFDLSAFRHHAFFDEEHGRIEMRLVSRWPQRVRIPFGGESVEIAFAEGEPITTEYSYKYDLDRFSELVGAAGWSVERCWTDERRWFAVQLLRHS